MEYEIKTDKFGRILDKNGVPLRDHRGRNHGPVAFRGAAGKPNPAQVKLNKRIQAHGDSKSENGFKRPGSLSK